LIFAAASAWPESFEQDKSNSIIKRWFPQHFQAPPANSMERHFQTWDAAHYLQLADHGYVVGQKSNAFYPLWPLAIHAFATLTRMSTVVAAIILANAFSLFGWTLFYHTASHRFGENVARWASIALILFPGSIFYQFAYTESLFFLLLMLLWFGLEEKKYAVAVIASLLLPLTRAIGVFCVLPIILHIMRTRDENPGGIFRALLLTSTPVAGLLLYFFLMWSWTGNSFEGIQAQRFWGAHSISNLWNLPKFAGGLFEATSWHDFRGSTLDRCLFMLLLYCLPIIWRMGKDFVAWTYVLGILPAMSGTYISFIRFESVAFPLFIALAVFCTRSKARWPVFVFFTVMSILHGVLLWRFINYRWAG
jgi:hypothetical protein